MEWTVCMAGTNERRSKIERCRLFWRILARAIIQTGNQGIFGERCVEDRAFSNLGRSSKNTIFSEIWHWFWIDDYFSFFHGAYFLLKSFHSSGKICARAWTSQYRHVRCTCVYSKTNFCGARENVVSGSSFINVSTFSEVNPCHPTFWVYLGCGLNLLRPPTPIKPEFFIHESEFFFFSSKICILTGFLLCFSLLCHKSEYETFYDC